MALRPSSIAQPRSSHRPGRDGTGRARPRRRAPGRASRARSAFSGGGSQNFRRTSPTARPVLCGAICALPDPNTIITFIFRTHSGGPMSSCRWYALLSGTFESNARPLDQFFGGEGGLHRPEGCATSFGTALISLLRERRRGRHCCWRCWFGWVRYVLCARSQGTRVCLEHPHR